MTAALESFAHVYQPGSNGRTLLLLHGTGGDEKSLLRFAPLLDPDAAVLSVRGKSLDEGYPRFFRRLAEGVFDVEDLKFRTHELADFLAAAYVEYNIGASQVVAFGYSNGANIASSLWLLRPQSIQGAIMVRPMLPFQPDGAIDLTGKSGLILSGKFDPMSPPGSVEALYELLKSSGVDVEWINQESGHELIQDDLIAARQWIARLPLAAS